MELLGNLVMKTFAHENLYHQGLFKCLLCFIYYF